MWKYLYNIAVYLALPFFSLFTLFNRKIRKNFRERLFPEGIGDSLQGWVWIHGASLGESAIAQNLVEQIGLQVPDARFLVTTNTYYARDLLQRKIGENVLVRSLPLDLPYSIDRFVGRSVFRGLILVETELWPNLIWKMHERDIPVVIVNGRISDSTIEKYKRLSPLLKQVFSCVDLVLAQSDSHAKRFIQLGMDPARVATSGNLKYFRNIAPLPGKQKNSEVVTFGSIKEKELEPITSVVLTLKKKFPQLKVFIAPRELRLTNAIEEALRSSLPTVRYSALKEDRKSYEFADVVVVDTVGDLMNIYEESQVAFVGGSLAPYGGQNMLEPLFFETPVLFGPHIENFKEVAEQIIAIGGGISVNNANELEEKISFLLNNEEVRTRIGKAGRGIIEGQNRVMVETVGRIREVLWNDCSRNL
jgi:3-deoxy-D-manno-octulosonic-acid transferase